MEKKDNRRKRKYESSASCFWQNSPRGPGALRCFFLKSPILSLSFVDHIEVFHIFLECPIFRAEQGLASSALVLGPLRCGVYPNKSLPPNHPKNKRYTIYVRVSPKILLATNILRGVCYFYFYPQLSDHPS